MPSRARPEDQAIAARFGVQLRRAREAAGLTQEALAESAGLHATFISNLERGYSAPTLGTIVRLAEGLNLDPGELVRGIRAT